MIYPMSLRMSSESFVLEFLIASSRLSQSSGERPYAFLANSFTSMKKGWLPGTSIASKQAVKI